MRPFRGRPGKQRRLLNDSEALTARRPHGGQRSTSGRWCGPSGSASHRRRRDGSRGERSSGTRSGDRQRARHRSNTSRQRKQRRTKGQIKVLTHQLHARSRTHDTWHRQERRRHPSPHTARAVGANHRRRPTGRGRSVAPGLARADHLGPNNTPTLTTRLPRRGTHLRRRAGIRGVGSERSGGKDKGPWG